MSIDEPIEAWFDKHSRAVEEADRLRVKLAVVECERDEARAELERSKRRYDDFTACG